jgi:hypothetical protein
MWMKSNDITGVLDLTFSLDISEFGKTKVVDLKPDGQQIEVTEDNKEEYVLIAHFTESVFNVSSRCVVVWC